MAIKNSWGCFQLSQPRAISFSTGKFRNGCTVNIFIDASIMEMVFTSMEAGSMTNYQSNCVKN